MVATFSCGCRWRQTTCPRGAGQRGPRRESPRRRGARAGLHDDVAPLVRGVAGPGRGHTMMWPRSSVVDRALAARCGVRGGGYTPMWPHGQSCCTGRCRPRDRGRRFGRAGDAFVPARTRRPSSGVNGFDRPSAVGRRSATLPRATINDRARATPPWRCHSMRPTSSRGPSALDGVAAAAGPLDTDRGERPH